MKYTADFSIDHTVKLYKKDLIELDQKLNSTFDKHKEFRTAYRLYCERYNINSNNFNDILEIDIEDTFESMYIDKTFNQQDENIFRSIRVNLTARIIRVSIESDSEVFVRGASDLIKHFFEKKKTRLNFYKKNSHIICGLIAGFGIAISINLFIFKQSYFIAALIFMLSIFFNIITYPRIENKFLPTVRVHFHDKKNNHLDSSLMFFLPHILAGLTLIVTIIFGLLQL